MITWNCRQCGEGMEAPDSAMEEFFECPKCGIQTSPKKFVNKDNKENSQRPNQSEGFHKKVGRVLNTPVFESPKKSGTVLGNVPELDRHYERCILGSKWVIVLGVVSFVVGFIFLIASLSMDRTGPYMSDMLNIGNLNKQIMSDTLNIGKLNEQLVYAIIGTGLVGSGAVMFAVGLCMCGVIRAVVVDGARSGPA